MIERNCETCDKAGGLAVMEEQLAETERRRDELQAQVARLRGGLEEALRMLTCRRLGFMTVREIELEGKTISRLSGLLTSGAAECSLENTSSKETGQ